MKTVQRLKNRKTSFLRSTRPAAVNAEGAIILCLQKATRPLRHIYNSFRHGARGSRFIPAPWSRASPGDASSGDTARSQQHGAARASAFDRFSPASGFSRSEQLR